MSVIKCHICQTEYEVENGGEFICGKCGAKLNSSTAVNQNNFSQYPPQNEADILADIVEKSNSSKKKNNRMIILFSALAVFIVVSIVAISLLTKNNIDNKENSDPVSEISSTVTVSENETVSEKTINTEYYSVTVPDSWIGNFFYDTSVEHDGFYHYLSFYTFGGYENEGSHLVSLVLTNDAFYEAASYELIAEISAKENYYLFAVYPTDVQSTPENRDIYMKMSEDIELMLKSVSSDKYDVTFMVSDEHNPDVESDDLFPWFDAYENILIKACELYPPEDYYCDYSVYDVNNDNIPELLLKIGTCEADYIYNFYKYDADNNKAIKFAEFSAGHTYVCGASGKNAVLFHWAHMGYESVTIVDFNDTQYSEKLLYENDSNVSGVEYLELTPIETYTIDDANGLFWITNTLDFNLQKIENALN